MSAIPFLKGRKVLRRSLMERNEPSVHLVYLSVMWEEFPQTKGNWQILNFVIDFISG